MARHRPPNLLGELSFIEPWDRSMFHARRQIHFMSLSLHAHLMGGKTDGWGTETGQSIDFQNRKGTQRFLSHPINAAFSKERI